MEIINLITNNTVVTPDALTKQEKKNIIVHHITHLVPQMHTRKNHITHNLSAVASNLLASRKIGLVIL